MAHSFLFWLFFSWLRNLCPGSKISWGFLFHLNAYLLPSKLYNGAWSVYRKSYKDSSPAETTSSWVNMMGADVHKLMKRKGKRRAFPFLTRLGSQRLFAWLNWSFLSKNTIHRGIYLSLDGSKAMLEDSRERCCVPSLTQTSLSLVWRVAEILPTQTFHLWNSLQIMVTH